MKNFIFLVLILILPQMAHAQGGGGNGGGANVGNGGGGYESEFKYFTSLLKQWITMGVLDVDTKAVPGGVIWNDVVQAMTLVSVQFTSRELKVELPNGQKSEARVCKNYPDLRKIECNSTLWSELPTDQKLAVVFHEYLGVTGYESNFGAYSSYPISSQLIGISQGEKISWKGSKFLNAVESSQATVLRSAPDVWVNWFRAKMGDRAELVIQPTGEMVLKNKDKDKYRSGSKMTGAYLSNGDYRVEAYFYENIRNETIGNTSFSIRHNSDCGTSFKLEIVWNAQIGIKVLDASTNCAYQAMYGKPRTTTELQPDGSIRVQKSIYGGGLSGERVKVRVNGVDYENTYVNPAFVQK